MKRGAKEALRSSREEEKRNVGMEGRVRHWGWKGLGGKGGREVGRRRVSCTLKVCALKNPKNPNPPKKNKQT